MAKVKFEFEIDEALAETIEEAEGKPVEDVLGATLTEVIRCKTHYEAKLVLRGKHRKIPQTSKNMARAKKVHEALCSDQVPEIPTKKFKVGVKKA